MHQDAGSWTDNPSPGLRGTSLAEPPLPEEKAGSEADCSRSAAGATQEVVRPSREVLTAWRAGPEIPCLPVLSVVTAAGSLSVRARYRTPARQGCRAGAAVGRRRVWAAQGLRHTRSSLRDSGGVPRASAGQRPPLAVSPSPEAR